MSSDEVKTLEESRAARASREVRGFWGWLRDKLATWRYLLPLLTVLAVLIVGGFKGIYILSFIIGTAVWHYWGSKMEMNDAVMVLCADIERKVIGVVAVGRGLWRSYDKEGEPVEWTSEGGHSVHYVMEHDEDEQKVVYPPKGYGPLEVTMEPKRYLKLIKQRQDLLESNAELEQDMKAAAFMQARKWSKRFEREITKAMEGPDENKD